MMTQGNQKKVFIYLFFDKVGQVVVYLEELE